MREIPFITSKEADDYLNNNTIECLLCGKYYHSLGQHLKKHDMSIGDYKERYNLPLNKSLAGNLYKAKGRFNMDRLKKEGILTNDHLTKEHYQMMTERAKKVGIQSGYKNICDNAKMKKAIKASVESRRNQTYCRNGHPFPKNKRRCQICNTENARRLNGHIPRDIALTLKQTVQDVGL